MKKLEVLCLRCRARHVLDDEDTRETSIEFHCTVCGLLIRARLSPFDVGDAPLPRPQTQPSHRATRQLPPPLPVMPPVEEPSPAGAGKGPRLETMEVSASAIMPLSEGSLAAIAPVVDGPAALPSLPFLDPAVIARRPNHGHRFARGLLLLCAPSLIVFGAGLLLLHLSGGPSSFDPSPLTRTQAAHVQPALGEIFTLPAVNAEPAFPTGLPIPVEAQPSEPEAAPIPVEAQPSEPEAAQLLVEKAAPEGPSAPAVAAAPERTPRARKLPSRPAVSGSPLKASTALGLLQRHGPRLQRCADIHLGGQTRQHEVRVRLQVSVGGNGAVKALSLSPLFLTTSEFGRCLTASVRHVQFPAHPGPDATFVLPVTVKVNRALHASR